METFDQIYADIIFELFGIRLGNHAEINDFYNNIDKILSREQIAELQIKISESLHDNKYEPTPKKMQSDKMDGVRAKRLPKLSEVEDIESIC